jgi:hypothetical protein
MLPRLIVFASACAASVWACSGASPPASHAPAEAAPAEASEAPPPVAAPHGKRAPCGSDQACNDDPSVSALWGRCLTSGVCECNEGFERSPTSDLCRPIDVE